MLRLFYVFNLKHFLAPLILAFVLPTALIAQVKQTAFDTMLKGLYKETVPIIESSDFKKLDSYVLLDTREKAEFDTSHIDQAKWVGYEAFDPARVKPFDKSDTIVVYCSVGYRSERIGEQLKEMGFETVYNLYGGIFHWVNMGNEVVDKAGNKTAKVHVYSKTWGIWLNNGEKVY